MYIPRLRRIPDAIAEIRSHDTDSNVTYRLIKELITEKKITPMKYGNTWLINLDELYSYLTIGNALPLRLPKIDKLSCKTGNLATSGELYRLFLSDDEGTIIRKSNLRQFVKDNGIAHQVFTKAWLINYEEFLKAVNPKGMQEHYELPRIRHKSSSVRLWNKEHPRRLIDKHVVEACVQDERVFFYKRENVWVVNYDQLETVIAEYMQTHVYTPQKTRKD